MTTPLRVAIGPLSSLEGGVRTHILNVVRYSNHHITPIPYVLLSPYWPGYRRVGYAAFAAKRLRLPDPYATTLVNVRLSQYDIVHTHGHPYWLSLYRALMRRRIPRIHTVHQIYREDECRSAREWTMRRHQNEALMTVCRAVDQVLSITPGLSETLRVEYGIDSVVIPNGADLEVCDRGDADRFLALYDLPPGFVLYVGGLPGVKRPELLYAIAKEMPSVAFVAAGPRMEVTTLTRVLGPPPPNVLPVGLLPHDVLIDAMHAGGAVLITSKREGCPFAVLEGLACRTPVVAPVGSGPDELLVALSPDLVYDRMDPGSAANCLLRALADSQIGYRAREYVARHHDAKVTTAGLDTLFREVAGDGPT